MMKSFCYLSFLLLCFIVLNTKSYATCGTPFDKNGSPVPAPNGNVLFIQVPQVFCGASGEYTWDYMGTVENSSHEKFSIQTTMVQLKSSLQYNDGISDHSMGAGFHEFYFSFENDHHKYYANSTYGGEENRLKSLSQSLSYVSSSASLENFQVTSKLLFSNENSWDFHFNNSVPYANLFLGYVGQPGAVYELQGKGDTYLWSYNEDGSAQKMLYEYNFHMQVRDERGVITQGFCGGYVGPEIGPQSDIAHNAEYEISQPRLKIISWTVDLSAHENIQFPDSFTSNYHFSGSDGMLYQDLGPVQIIKQKTIFNSKAFHDIVLTALDDPSKLIISKNKENQNILNSFVKNDSNFNMSRLANSENKFNSKDESQSLYRGNWVYIQFTKGKYSGTQLQSSVFWLKDEEYSQNQTSDDFDWLRFGWLGIFTGILPENLSSTVTFTEGVLPYLPHILVNKSELPAGWLNPFEFKIQNYVDKKYASKFPWAQSILLKIRANSPSRYILANYANQKNVLWNAKTDSPESDLNFELNAISPVTQNTLFSSTISQFYEGAATVTLNGEDVGYAWIEHMN